MGTISLILGGARSGKTGFALEYATRLGSQRVYIATAQALDGEMERRIKEHQRNRSSDWKTIEEPLRLSTVLGSLERETDVVVIDCLTLWLSNLMTKMEGDEKQIRDEMDLLVTSVSSPSIPIIIISNEVGLGIVPADGMSRLFRDLSGFLHQQLAELATEVYLMVAGIPMKIKGVPHAVN